MSKHKFLFKHSVFYNNSKHGQFQTWTDSDTGSSGEVDKSGVSCAKEPLESLGCSQLNQLLPSDYPVSWNGQFPLGYLNFQSSSECLDNGCTIPSALTHGEQDLGTDGTDIEQYSSGPSSTLTTLTTAIPGGQNDSYIDSSKERYGYDPFPQNQLSNLQLSFPGSIPWNCHTDLGVPQSDPTSSEINGISDYPCSEADNFWSIPDKTNSSLESYQNISTNEVHSEESPVCEQSNTTSVIKASNRVGVITKAPSQNSKPAVKLQSDAGKTDTPSRNAPNHNIIVHESDGVVSYECRVCKKKFKSKNNWKYHVHSTDGTKFSYTCEHCGKGMFASTHYRYHLLTHSGERPYKCATCSKGFLTAAKLDRHILIHNEEKLQKCLECPKAFHSASELRRHQLTHSGEQPYVCQICDKKFVIASQLKNHELIHTGQHKYACETCGKRFQRLKHLENHNLIHIGTKPFRCEKCNKCFRTQASHSHHMKTHDDERPYRCSTCGRAFLLEKDYNRHQNIHTGVAPFTCTQCDRTFRRKDNLIRHNKIYHLEAKHDKNALPTRL
ncbi:unnamed protein product [Allacma fusca]|uniref:C2H2-type domain-containing protein n=1 Tax=Allacma fusca TaxID=39272 RepID=A0A8J2PK40_9HEXA|nr:unnamed protein product [Allacma fusca]